MRAVPAALLVAIALVVAGAASADPVVPTDRGAVQGIQAGSVLAFLGIPYAAPPIGALRWQPPEAHAFWDTVLLADAFACPCPQKDFDQGVPGPGVITGDEDCLYLNVWTPGLGGALPVLVFIHGGGNQQGSASDTTAGALIYDGRYLADREQVVVVTADYRLGPLGFLVHPGLDTENPRGVSGNYGLLDQILALTWVRENIAAFGGDPDRVLLFGESAGAVDTANLLTSPLAAGLFQRVAIQSGAVKASTAEVAGFNGLAFARDMGCDSGTLADRIACLRALDADSLVAHLSRPLDAGLVSSSWGPNVDGWVLPEDPEEALLDGEFNHVPILVGSNADETGQSSPFVVTPEDVDSLLTLIVPDPLLPTALYLYPPGTTNAQARDSYVGATTDAQFTVSARRIARAAEPQQTPPVWRYFFTHELSGPTSFYGAFHGLDLFFVFRTLENSVYGSGGSLTPADTTVMSIMGGCWARFAATGDPNGGGLPAWPAYAEGDDSYLEIAAAPAAGTWVRKAECDFWDLVRGGIVGVQLPPDDLPEPSPSVPSLAVSTPCRGGAPVRYAVASPGRVTLRVYDVAGRRRATLVDADRAPGMYAATLDAFHGSAGIHFLVLESGGARLVRRVLVID